MGNSLLAVRDINHIYIVVERVGRKCILFSRIRVQSSVGKDEIKVQAAARRKKMAISVESRAAVTEPEKYIRDIRRIKK